MGRTRLEEQEVFVRLMVAVLDGYESCRQMEWEIARLWRDLKRRTRNVCCVWKGDGSVKGSE